MRSPITGCPLTSAPSATLSLLRLSVNAGRLDRLLEAHQLRRLVRHLDADRRFARDERLDPDRRGQREREVGLIPEDAAHRHADRRLQLVLRDRRPAVGPDDAGLDAERLQGAHDLVTCGTNLGGEALALAGDGVEQLGGRQHPDLLRLVADHRRVAEADLRHRSDRGTGASPASPGTPSNSRVKPCSPRSSPVACGSSGSRNAVSGGGGSLGRVERQQHRHPGQLGGRLRAAAQGTRGARAARRAGRPIAAQPLALRRRTSGRAPGSPCPVRRSVARITPRTARPRPARRPRRRHRARARRPSRSSAPARRRRQPIMPISPRSASIATALPRAASVPARHSGVMHRRVPVRTSPATPIQAPTPNAPKSPSCTGPATAPPPGRTQHRREDHARRRSRRCRSAHGEGRDGAAAPATGVGARERDARARDAAMACACAWDGLGRSEPCRELDVERVEDGLPGPLDRARCYQQIGRRKCGDGCGSAGRLGDARRTSVPILHECVVVVTFVSERQTSVTSGQDQRPPLGFLVEESREPLVDRPLPRRVPGVRGEPRHQRQHVLARLVEERVGVVGDEARATRGRGPPPPRRSNARRSAPRGSPRPGRAAGDRGRRRRPPPRC